MPSPAPAPVCPYGVLPEDHNSNPCAVKPAPAPAECPGCRELAALQALSRDQATIIRNTRADAEAEVAALQAWKAEAQQRGAEMARRGLEVCAEVERLREALSIAASHLDECSKSICNEAGLFARAALKGDGQSPPPRWNVTDSPPGCPFPFPHDPDSPMAVALGCSLRAHRRR